MRLRHVTLATADPDALQPFYADALGLPVSNTAEGFVVAVGRSALEFRAADEGDPFYHVAFSVPGDTEDEAADWLDDRAGLLTAADRTQFRYDFLDATAVYAADPAGNVLELLARDDREGPTDPFGPDSLLDVGEIGITTSDVPWAANRLDRTFGLQSDPREEFAYVGGPAGAFVLATPGREWFPTDRGAEIAPLSVVAEGGTGALSFAEGPVSVVGIGD
jgi:catechol 2,3-dioxygenase-like lactoylglutathione lyase family enzyme